MIRGHAGFVQADRDDGRVPDRREARLDADAVVGFVFELLQLAFRAQHLRMIVRITQRLERDQRIEHRREKWRPGRREPSKRSSIHCSAFLQRAFAERMDAVLGEPLGELVQPVQPEEKIAPRKSCPGRAAARGRARESPADTARRD